MTTASPIQSAAETCESCTAAEADPPNSGQIFAIGCLGCSARMWASLNPDAALFAWRDIAEPDREALRRMFKTEIAAALPLVQMWGQIIRRARRQPPEQKA